MVKIASAPKMRSEHAEPIYEALDLTRKGDVVRMNPKNQLYSLRNTRARNQISTK